ncbi:hypothetical protein GCM10010985_29810 [Caballeronia grimmiae]|uniref:Transposase n=1 Tax=Caballeronia grimmiae TaxID=1071679 RepID=A0ABQ1RMQ5_9BURK|nr:hypothetical protein GCM10010985_29810 [Caballeronia grimmiae]
MRPSGGVSSGNWVSSVLSLSGWQKHLIRLAKVPADAPGALIPRNTARAMPKINPIM